VEINAQGSVDTVRRYPGDFTAVEFDQEVIKENK
jgi:hypothetical protein